MERAGIRRASTPSEDEYEWPDSTQRTNASKNLLFSPNGVPLKFYIHSSMDESPHQRKTVVDLIMENGGDMRASSQNAAVIIANRSWSGFNTLARQLARSGNHVESSEWVDQCIRMGNIKHTCVPKLIVTGGRTGGEQPQPFTSDEKWHLIYYIAHRCPTRQNRSGKRIYDQLVLSGRAWAKQHSSQSWRNQYVKNTTYYDPRIDRYVAKHPELLDAVDRYITDYRDEPGTGAKLPDLPSPITVHGRVWSGKQRAREANKDTPGDEEEEGIALTRRPTRVPVSLNSQKHKNPSHLSHNSPLSTQQTAVNRPSVSSIRPPLLPQGKQSSAGVNSIRPSARSRFRDPGPSQTSDSVGEGNDGGNAQLQQLWEPLYVTSRSEVHPTPNREEYAIDADDVAAFAAFDTDDQLVDAPRANTSIDRSDEPPPVATENASSSDSEPRRKTRKSTRISAVTAVHLISPPANQPHIMQTTPAGEHPRLFGNRIPHIDFTKRSSSKTKIPDPVFPINTHQDLRRRVPRISWVDPPASSSSKRSRDHADTNTPERLFPATLALNHSAPIAPASLTAEQILAWFQQEAERTGNTRENVYEAFGGMLRGESGVEREPVSKRKRLKSITSLVHGGDSPAPTPATVTASHPARKGLKGKTKPQHGKAKDVVTSINPPQTRSRSRSQTPNVAGTSDLSRGKRPLNTAAFITVDENSNDHDYEDADMLTAESRATRVDRHLETTWQVDVQQMPR